MKIKDFIYSKRKEKKHNVLIFLGIKIKYKPLRLETKFQRKEKPYDVGILSVNMNSRICNFGAALHSYAFHKYLEKNGVNSVIINYYPESIRSMFVTTQMFQNLKKCELKKLFINLCNAFFIFYKKNKFSRFFKKNCRITKYRYELDTLPQLKNINRFVVETDVTWLKYKSGFDRGFFCDLENMKNKDNVAYSVDFGSKIFSESDSKKFQKYMNNFKYISIRNIYKFDYFKQITGRNDAVITVDPVFLLDKADYQKIISKPKIKDDYVFVFNCVENNPEMVEQASKYAMEHNLKLVVVNSFVNNIIDWKKSFPTPIGVEEFLGYIQNCKYFFTNSYHGICFAIIFGIPFACYERCGNNDKILTILKLFGLENRLVKNSSLPNFEIDYSNVNKKWLELRKESEIFIAKSNIVNLYNPCVERIFGGG